MLVAAPLEALENVRINVARRADARMTEDLLYDLEEIAKDIVGDTPDEGDDLVVCCLVHHHARPFAALVLENEPLVKPLSPPMHNPKWTENSAHQCWRARLSFALTSQWKEFDDVRPNRRCDTIAVA
jgi:hypothetical protein